MGDRAQVLIEDEKVYLYTHWGGIDLPSIVAQSLNRRQRWDDPEYLARIIFSEMICGNIDGETGFGIGTTEHGDINRLIAVNCKDKTVTIKSMWDKTKPASYTFEEFIEKYTRLE